MKYVRDELIDLALNASSAKLAVGLAAMLRDGDVYYYIGFVKISAACDSFCCGSCLHVPHTWARTSCRTAEPCPIRRITESPKQGWADCTLPLKPRASAEPCCVRGVCVCVCACVCRLCVRNNPSQFTPQRVCVCMCVCVDIQPALRQRHLVLLNQRQQYGRSLHH